MGKKSCTMRVACRVLCYTLLLQASPAAQGQGLPAAPSPEWVEAGRIAAEPDRPAIGGLPAASASSPAPRPRQTRAASVEPRTAFRAELRKAPAEERVEEPPSAPAPIRPEDLPPFPPAMEGATLPRAAAATALTATSLIPGWNLASVQNQPPDPTPAAVFSSIAGTFTRVWAYDACAPGDPWKVYDPADAAVSNLTAVDQEIGFWIEMTAPAPVPSPGTLADETTIHLCTGWNLIGFPAGQARPVRTALSSIEGKYARVFGFDPADTSDPWEIYDVAVPAWANDLELMQPGRGYWVLATSETDLVISNAGAEPEVAITAPSDLAVVTAPTDVIGTVKSDRLESWTLSYRAHGDAEGAVFASGNTPVVNGRLGTFDPTLLLNGGYTVELTATDFNGQSSTVSIDVSAEGQMKIGNFTLQYIDLEIPLSGLPIQVVRNYDSRDKRRGDFGVGWTLELRQGTYRNNRPPGEGWDISSGFLPCQEVTEIETHLTTIRLSDQEIYRFKPGLASPAPTLGGCFAQARFDFVDGPVPGATLAILGNTEVIYQNGTDYVVDSGSFEIYEPQQVRLTLRDGRVFDLHIQQGVTRLQDVSANTLSITPGAITHSSGRSVAIQRDSLGRIASITDPAAKSVTYAYDAAGDLVSVTDRESNTTQLTYAANHHLLEIEDPQGRQPVRNEYDGSGRLIRTTDSQGRTVEFEHRLGDRVEVVTDRLGRVRALEYDQRGNVVREVDTAGKETLRTFDAKDRILTQTDPLGNTTAYTYDAFGNITRVTDPAGNATAYTYNSRGQVLAMLDSRGKLTKRTYDAKGNLTTVIDPLGNTTSYTYDGAGNVLTETGPEGHVTAYVVDTFGNTVKQVDALGHETTFTFDANGNELTRTTSRTTASGTETLTWTSVYDDAGRLVRSVDPDGTFTTTAYDHRGNVVEKVDKLGRRTTFAYDGTGLLTTTAYPDGTSEVRTYDAEGRLASQTDRAGRTTTFERDPLGRLLKAVLPDGSEIQNTYDDAGRLIAIRDARGNTTSYEDDDAGRRTKIIDPDGGEMVFGYDPNGNQTSVRDPRGKTTTYEYDDANRLIRILFPDGTDREIGYDRRGKKTAETDPAGKTTRYAYDGLGNLTTVTDALSQATRFAYDEVGNRVSQTDAAGRETRFEYDRLGRMARRVLPLGHAESRTYDAAGNLISRTDFGGSTVTFTYDSDDRLIRRRYPDGSSVSLTYTPTGRRASATDARGTTVYQYDDRDRLTGVDLPGGRSLSYAYDRNGNRTALGLTVAASTFATSFSYDDLNRLEAVTDPQGRLYQHGYDASGNRTSLEHPNGVRTTYAHDDLNRLTGLEARNGVGAVVQSYLYTLGPAGNRTRVEEHGGAVRTYEHDDLYRLSRETVSVAGVAQLDDSFTYDAVGNRLSRTRIDGSGTVTTPYTYDARDRLLTKGGDSFTWDDNGNLVLQSGADGAAYVWDYDHRLVRVTKLDGTVVTHAYDADGNRVRTEVTPPNGPPTVTEYVVDASRELSQVVADLLGHAVVAYYLRGDDLLAVIRGSGTRFYHADGLGSIRALTDESGNVTDTYTFTAFGELLSHAGSDPNAYLFAGEALDANSGFYYLRARWMDPAVGRFASIDPFAGLAFEPLTLHRYLYAGANPVDFVDPSGLVVGGFSGLIAGAIASIQGRIASLSSSGLAFLYVMRNLRALNWTLTALRAIQARFGNLFVTLEEALVRSRGSIDMVLRRAAGALQRVSIELKNWNIDAIARSPQRAQGMLDQLQRQAQNFRAENVEAIYGFAEKAATPQGQALLIQIRNILTTNGHRITFGTQQLLDEIGKYL